MILFINNEHCSSLEQLKGYFTQASPNNDIYWDLLDYGRSGDISKWLGEMGENGIANKFEAIDSSLSDHKYFSEMALLLLKDKFSSDKIQKPIPSHVFNLEEVKTEVFDKETKVHLIIKVLLTVNEDYEVKVLTGWGTRAIKFNPSNLSEGKNVKETFVYRKRPGKELGKVEVCIDGELVFEDNIQTKRDNSQTLETNCSTYESYNLQDLLEKSEAPRLISDVVGWLGRLKQIEENKSKTNIPRTHSTSSAKKESEYIRTIGRLMPKEEWLKRREQERQEIECERQKKETERQRKIEKDERDEMIARWRRRHSM